jgi:hypothetical protein
LSLEVDLRNSQLTNISKEKQKMVNFADEEHCLRDEIADDVETSVAETLMETRADSAGGHEAAHHAPERAERRD